MTALAILASLMLTASGSAAPENFSACHAFLAIHHFTNCPGESQPCEVRKENLGNLVVDLAVSGRDQATGNAVFKADSGVLTESPLDCALTDENGDVNDMECVMRKPVNDRLGRLSLSFNSAEAPYYVVVFQEFGNAPIGSFSTDLDCH